jgi:uncharacterized small protein (DUF1192 family)
MADLERKMAALAAERERLEEQLNQAQVCSRLTAHALAG